jgi:hypothetical protein
MICLFESSTCFKQLCAHPQKDNCINTISGCNHSVLVAVRYACQDEVSSLQGCSKHVEDSNKHITEETVRQVGYLPELYEDARSEKYNIL